MHTFDAVFLIGFGGPNNLGEVPAYLDNLYRPRSQPRGGCEQIVEKYRTVAERYRPHSVAQRQSQMLMSLFRGQNVDLHVYFGMRFWHPFVGETLAVMANDGVKHAAGILLVPFPSDTTWKQYIEAVHVGQDRLGMSAPEVDFLPAWHKDERFVDVIVEQVAEEFLCIPPKERSKTLVLFTALGLHHCLDTKWGYSEELKETAGQVAARLNTRNWDLMFLRRSGDPAEPWLQKDPEAALAAAVAKGYTHVIVSPLGVVTDQIELLYDVDVVLKERAKRLGLTLSRARTVSDHPQFLSMLAENVLEFENHGPSAPTLKPSSNVSSSSIQTPDFKK